MPDAFPMIARCLQRQDNDERCFIGVDALNIDTTPHPPHAESYVYADDAKMHVPNLMLWNGSAHRAVLTLK